MCLSAILHEGETYVVHLSLFDNLLMNAYIQICPCIIKCVFATIWHTCPIVHFEQQST